MKTKKILAMVFATATLATSVVPVFAEATRYNVKTEYNLEVSDSKGNLKAGYEMAEATTPNVKLYSTTSWDEVNNDTWKEVTKAEYDAVKDNALRKAEVTSEFTEWVEVSGDSKEFADAKAKGKDFYKVETNKKNTAAYDKANALPLFNSNGVSFNYIVKDKIVLGCHTRGNLFVGKACYGDVQGTVDGEVVVMSQADTDNFEKFWSSLGEKYGQKVTQSDINKLKYNYANEWMRKLTDDGSDQSVRYGDIPVYYTDAKEVNFTGIYGVLIAPYAKVTIDSCNACGTVVAKEVTSQAEYHLWDWTGKQVDEDHYFVRDSVVKYFITEYKTLFDYKYCVKTGEGTPKTGDSDTALVVIIASMVLVAGALCVLGTKKKSI